MASKNLGAVIQRAISDGAFRRQLQSDPAAALRGFNLSPDEIAAVRSGDSSKLMSLGVDQRMSKAFTLGAQGSQATRAAMTGDVSGSTTNVLAGGDTASTRDSIVGDPNSGARAATTDGDNTTGARSAMTDGDNTTGARDAHSSGSLSGTRATIGTGQQDTYRAVNDPDNTGGTRESVSDSTLAGTHSATSTGQQDSYRAINDPDNTGGTRETVSDSTLAGTHASATAGDAGAGNANIMADENYSVASRMHDANADLSLPGSDVQHDPGFVDTHSAFIPADSADVQREMQDGLTGTGDALGHTDHTGINS